MTDKGPFVMGIEQGLAMNHCDMRRETVKRSQNGALCKGWRGDILQKALEGMHKGVWSCDRMEAKLKEYAQRLHTGKHCS